MKNKKLVIAAVALVLVIALMAGLYLTTRPQAEEGSKQVTVVIVHKDGTEKNFTYHTDEEFLGPVLLAEGLIEGEEGPYGLMISTVDGELADWNVDQGYWAVYEGEEYAMQGIDQTPVYDGSTFKLVYTIG